MCYYIYFKKFKYLFIRYYTQFFIRFYVNSNLSRLPTTSYILSASILREYQWKQNYRMQNVCTSLIIISGNLFLTSISRLQFQLISYLN